MTRATTSSSQRSVRTFLIGLVLGCLLPGLIGAGILFVNQYQEGRIRQQGDTVQTARALAQAVDSYLLRGQAIAQVLSTSDALVNHDFARFHQRAREVLALNGLGTNVVLRDKTGQLLLNTAVEYGTPLPRQSVSQHIQSIFENGKPVISDLFIGMPLKRPIASVDVPVVIDGKVAYAIGLGILPEQFSAILKAQKIPSEWTATVFDSTGTIVGRSRSPEKFVGSKVTDKLLRSIAQFPERSIESITLEDIPVITSYSRSSATSWGVAIGIPRQSSVKTLLFPLVPIVAGILALFGIGFALAWFVGGRVAYSVKALTAPAMALGNGGAVNIPKVHIREAAEVASAIGRAADLLNERSAALHARDAQLLEAYRLSKFGTWHWNPGTGEVKLSESVPEIYGLKEVPPFGEQRGTLLTVESWERVRKAVQEAMQTGRGYDIEVQANHSGGYPIWLHFKCEVVRDEKGEVLAIHGTIQDITERKENEQALRRSERAAVEAAHQAEAERHLLGTVLEATPIAIVVADANGALLQSNALNKSLWGESQPSANTIEEYGKWKGWWADGSQKQGWPVEPDEWPLSRALRGMDASRDIIEIEPFGEPPIRKIVLMSAAPVKDHEGKIIGGVVAQMDITDRVRAEETLKQADKRKDEFLAMLAHELRNPLAPISAAADLLGLERMDVSRVRQVSAIITRQVRHMTALVDDLLDVSRVTRGLVTLSKHALNADEIVADAVEQVKPLAQGKKQRLTVRAGDQQSWVLGDHKRLVQVIANLLHNAVKFTPEGGELNVQVKTGHDKVEISIADNGIGMAPDMVRHAFELFVQGERTSDRSQGGLGIGLALVKSLVELHGGTISAHSEGAGKGSRFTVCLPRVKENIDKTALNSSAPGMASSSKALKVLVVDDNADAALSLAMLLESWGHEAFVENDSCQALERALKEQPDVCLLDIGLPGMDGNELARRLKAMPETTRIRLIAITGYGQELDREAAFEAGFDHHFVKPVNSSELASIFSTIGSH